MPEDWVRNSRALAYIQACRITARFRVHVVHVTHIVFFTLAYTTRLYFSCRVSYWIRKYIIRTLWRCLQVRILKSHSLIFIYTHTMCSKILGKLSAYSTDAHPQPPPPSHHPNPEPPAKQHVVYFKGTQWRGVYSNDATPKRPNKLLCTLFALTLLMISTR